MEFRLLFSEACDFFFVLQKSQNKVFVLFIFEKLRQPRRKELNNFPRAVNYFVSKYIQVAILKGCDRMQRRGQNTFSCWASPLEAPCQNKHPTKLLSSKHSSALSLSFPFIAICFFFIVFSFDVVPDHLGKRGRPEEINSQSSSIRLLWKLTRLVVHSSGRASHKTLTPEKL